MTIVYHGGPMNKLVAEDLGHVTPRFSITRPHPQKPEKRQTGYAIYELSKDGSEAYWLNNEWEMPILLKKGLFGTK